MYECQGGFGRVRWLPGAKPSLCDLCVPVVSLVQADEARYPFSRAPPAYIRASLYSYWWTQPNEDGYVQPPHEAFTTSSALSQPLVLRDALHVRCFPSPNTPDSNECVVTRLLLSLRRTHSFESGALEQGNIQNTQGRGGGP